MRRSLNNLRRSDFRAGVAAAQAFHYLFRVLPSIRFTTYLKFGKSAADCNVALCTRAQFQITAFLPSDRMQMKYHVVTAILNTGIFVRFARDFG